MSTPNETAEAILIVVKRIMKWLVISAVVAIVGFLALIQAGTFWDWLTVGRYEEKVKITFHVADSSDCDKDYPYIYIVQNKSDKTLEEIEFSIELRKVGYSNKINSYTSITESKILKSNENIAGCFRAQQNDFNGFIKDKDVDFKLSYKRVKFEK